MDVEAEIRDLKRRVGELEGSFGFLTQQLRAVHTDLLEFRQETERRFDRIEQETERRFDRIEQETERRFDRVEQGQQVLNGNFDSLRRDLPNIIAQAVGEALRR